MNWPGLLEAMNAASLSEVLLAASSLAPFEDLETSSWDLSEDDAVEPSFFEAELALAGFSSPSRLAKVFASAFDGCCNTFAAVRPAGLGERFVMADGVWGIT